MIARTLNTLSSKQRYTLPLRAYVVTFAHISQMRSRHVYVDARNIPDAKARAMRLVGWDWPNVLTVYPMLDD